MLRDTADLRRGDLMRFTSQQFEVQHVAKTKEKGTAKTHQLLFGRNHGVPLSFEMLLVSDPLNHRERRASVSIQRGRRQPVPETMQQSLVSQYIEFGDHISYGADAANAPSERVSGGGNGRNPKRKRSEMTECSDRERINSMESDGAPPAKKRKITNLADAESAGGDDEEQREHSVRSKQPKQSKLSAYFETSVEAAQCDGGTVGEDTDGTLERDHLPLPTHLANDASSLLVFKGETVLRMVYDSEDDLQQIAGNVDVTDIPAAECLFHHETIRNLCGRSKYWSRPRESP